MLLGISNFEFLGAEKKALTEIERRFAGLLKAFESFNFTKEDMEAVWKTLAGILWLGNINFTNNHHDQAQIVPCKYFPFILFDYL